MSSADQLRNLKKCSVYYAVKATLWVSPQREKMHKSSIVAEAVRSVASKRGEKCIWSLNTMTTHEFIFPVRSVKFPRARVRSTYVLLGTLLFFTAGAAVAQGGPIAKKRWTRTYQFACEQGLPTRVGMRTMEQVSTTVCMAETGPAFAANICSNSGQPPTCTCTCYYYTEIPVLLQDPISLPE